MRMFQTKNKNIFSHYLQVSEKSTLVHGNKAKLERPLDLIAVQIELSNFRAWPYCGEIETFKILGLALLRCISIFEIFNFGLIAVQTDVPNFRAWPYYGANRLGLFAVHQCT